MTHKYWLNVKLHVQCKIRHFKRNWPKKQRDIQSIINILSLSPLKVVPNMYSFLSSVEQKKKVFESMMVTKQLMTPPPPPRLHTMEVNGYHELFVKNILQNYDDRIFIFVGTIQIDVHTFKCTNYGIIQFKKAFYIVSPWRYKCLLLLHHPLPWAGSCWWMVLAVPCRSCP